MINQMDTVDAWYLIRWTKFTASEIYKLLLGGKGGEIFGAGANTYIKTKALEMSTQMQERPEMEEVKSLLWGKVHEQPAFEWYVKATKNRSMKYLGTENPLFLEYEAIPNEAGGSPDAISLTSDAKVNGGAEIKCPKNSMYHFDRMKWKTMWDVKEGYIECYSQIQMLMMINEAPVWHFVSFDDRFTDFKKKGKIIEILPDKKFQDNLDLRIRMAVKEKYKIFNEYMNA
jgi:hypothetical protein